MVGLNRGRRARSSFNGKTKGKKIAVYERSLKSEV